MAKTTDIAMAVRADYLNPHHQEVIEGVQRYAASAPGWRCVIDEHPGDAANHKGQHYDGVVARASPAMQKRMREQHTPLVNVWYQHANTEQHGVYLDLGQAGTMAAEHLIQRGFRRLYYVGVQRYRHAREVAQAIEAVTGQAPEFVASPGSYDQKHIDRIGKLKNCIAYGPGILELAHKPDEWIGVDDMITSAQVMGQTLLALLGPKPA